MITVDKSLSARKEDLLAYFGERGSESLEEIRRAYGATEFRAQASAINMATTETRDNIIKNLVQKSIRG